jgi:hypothetical protein
VNVVDRLDRKVVLHEPSLPAMIDSYNYPRLH